MIYYSEYLNHINTDYNNIHEAMEDIHKLYQHTNLFTLDYPDYPIAIFSDIYAAINALAPDYIEIDADEQEIRINTYFQDDCYTYTYYPYDKVEDSTLDLVVEATNLPNPDNLSVKELCLKKYFLT